MSKDNHQSDERKTKQNTANTPDADNAGGQGEGGKSLLFFFIALGCLAAGALLFGLAFAIKGAGTYMLIASMFSTLACATFLNAQKRRYNFKAVMPVRIVCYAVMIAALIVFMLGTIASAK